MACEKSLCLRRAISLLSICLIGYMPVVLNAQSDSETEIRVQIQRYFAANTTMETKRVAVRNVSLTGDKAIARVVIEINAIDAKTGKRSEELTKKCRTLHLAIANLRQLPPTNSRNGQ